MNCEVAKEFEEKLGLWYIKINEPIIMGYNILL